MSWSAKQYTLFEQQRTRPVRDLVAAITTDPVRTAIDLGCGPGNSTEVLAQRYPEALICGLDSSADMLSDARQRLPNVNFSQADIAAWKPTQPVDVILANASLQWVPDHAQLFPHLVDRLAPNGTLAVQMPDNLEEPAHVLARQVAQDPRWANSIAAVKHPPRHPASFYYDLLHTQCSSIDVWRTTYYHPLAGGHDAVVEWFKGSALRPFLAPLNPQQQADFIDAYREQISLAYPAFEDGTVLLPFPRLFINATR